MSSYWERYQPPPLRRRMDPLAAAGSALADTVSFGFGDELAGAGAGALNVLRGRDYLSAYRAQADRSRANLARAWEDQPLATGAGMLAGAVVPAVAAGRLVRTGASLGTRLATAGASGAVGGGIAGAGAANGDLEERLRGAGFGAAAGAVLGGGLAAVGEAVPLGTRLLPSSRQTRSQSISDEVLSDIMRRASDMDASVRTPTDAAAMIRRNAAGAPDMTVAEALGAGGIQRTTSLTRRSNRAAQIADETLRPRMAATRRRFEDTVLTPGIPSGDEMIESLRQQWRTTGTQALEPVFQQPPRVDRLAQSQVWSRLQQHPAVAEALKRADDLMRGEIALGNVAPDQAQNIARRLHYAKMALDDMIVDPTTAPRGWGATVNRSMVTAAEQLRGVIDDVAPGYQQTLGSLADIATAQRAVQLGRDVFNRNAARTPEEYARLVGALPRNATQAFDAGINDAIMDLIRSASRDGGGNIANRLLQDARFDRLAVALGRERAEDIRRFAQQELRMWEAANRMRPNVNSPTGSVAADMAEDAARAPPRPTMSGIADSVWRNLYEAAAGPRAQRRMEELAQVYFSPAMGAGVTGAAERSLRAQGLLAAARRGRSRLERTRNAYTLGIGIGPAFTPEEEDPYA
jgi:hypothetical protein